MTRLAEQPLPCPHRQHRRLAGATRGNFAVASVSGSTSWIGSIGWPASRRTPAATGARHRSQRASQASSAVRAAHALATRSAAPARERRSTIAADGLPLERAVAALTDLGTPVEVRGVALGLACGQGPTGPCAPRRHAGSPRPPPRAAPDAAPRSRRAAMRPPCRSSTRARPPETTRASAPASKCTPRAAVLCRFRQALAPPRSPGESPPRPCAGSPSCSMPAAGARAASSARSRMRASGLGDVAARAGAKKRHRAAAGPRSWFADATDQGHEGAARRRPGPGRTARSMPSGVCGIRWARASASTHDASRASCSPSPRHGRARQCVPKLGEEQAATSRARPTRFHLFRFGGDGPESACRRSSVELLGIVTSPFQLGAFGVAGVPFGVCRVPRAP